MDPHTEYLLVPAETEEYTNTENPPKSFRVELFVNNEYQGQYSLKTSGDRQQPPRQ